MVNVRYVQFLKIPVLIVAVVMLCGWKNKDKDDRLPSYPPRNIEEALAYEDMKRDIMTDVKEEMKKERENIKEEVREEMEKD